MLGVFVTLRRVIKIKTLLLDIETSPNTVHVWGLREQDISINQILESSYVLCWAAKWLGHGPVMFARTTNPAKGSTRSMIVKVHKLLSEADSVIHYNGSKFDIPTLNKEFILHGLTHPAPYKQMDLLKVAREQFRFTSNKLDYVADALGLGKKTQHEGHMLWVKCMADDPQAWHRMEKYNKNDVVLLEKLYYKLLPWMKTHTNQSLYEEEAVCPTCGSSKFQRRGFAYTQAGKYRRFQCQTCSSWFRGTTSVMPKGKKMVAI